MTPLYWLVFAVCLSALLAYKRAPLVVVCVPVVTIAALLSVSLLADTSAPMWLVAVPFVLALACLGYVAVRRVGGA